ncbi:MAG TPA: twin transmembrane helix small protein [Methylococcus sp.]|jgi:hypothetical protein|nr:twin transmembrane helix small protein [Methylococcus sp.]
MLAKIIVLLVLGAIVASLGSALYYLLKDADRRSPRTVKALTLRIGLSIALFFSLLLGYRLGFLHPHGLKPDFQAPRVSPGEGGQRSRLAPGERP